MVPYYLLFCIPIFVHFLNKKATPFKRNLIAGSFFLILIIMLSLRSVECGTDLKGYLSYFEKARNISWKEVFHQGLEPGYGFFQKVVSLFSAGFNVFLTLVALISIVPIWVLYASERENALLAVLAFTAIAPFSMYFSGLRQILAMGIGIIAWFFVRKKRFVLFVAFFWECWVSLFFPCGRKKQNYYPSR